MSPTCRKEHRPWISISPSPASRPTLPASRATPIDATVSLDALDWSALDEQTAREAAMLDDLLAGDLADAALYILWLEERLASGETDVPGVLRFYPHPRPWHAEWISLH